MIHRLKARDPETAKIVRRLGVERLRTLAEEDPTVAHLAEDPSDPFHHEYLLVIPDISLLTYIARGRMKGGNNTSVIEAMFGGSR